MLQCCCAGILPWHCYTTILTLAILARLNRAACSSPCSLPARHTFYARALGSSAARACNRCSAAGSCGTSSGVRLLPAAATIPGSWRARAYYDCRQFAIQRRFMTDARPVHGFAARALRVACAAAAPRATTRACILLTGFFQRVVRISVRLAPVYLRWFAFRTLLLPLAVRSLPCPAQPACAAGG